MKRLLLVLLMAGLLSAFLSAADFGGNLEDSTYYHYASDSSFFHADTLALWLNTEVWKDTDLYIQGNYTYTTEQPYAFDLISFKLENRSASLVNYTLGRFYTYDFSGYVFSGRLDGAAVNLNYPWGVISARAGYTGLLFNTSNIEMTLADQNDPDGVFDLEAPRLINGIEVELPDLFLMQNLKLGFWAQFDLRPDSEVTAENEVVPSSTGGKISSQYLGAELNGSPLENLYYDAFVYLGTGRTLSYINSKYTYKPMLSFLGSGGVRYFFPQMLSSKLDFRFLYSSGDEDYTSSFLEGNSDGYATSFTPVTGKNLALVFNPKLGNIFFTRLNYSLKPFEDKGDDILKHIQMELTNVIFFRPTTGQISGGGVNTTSTSSLYLGTEIDGTVNFRPFSDLGLSLTSGVFIPNTADNGAFSAALRKTEFLARLGLSFSF